MTADLSQICIPPDSTIRKGMECIDRNCKGIVLICDLQRRLLSTITDGDIRRALLLGENLDEPITRLLVYKEDSAHAKPATAPYGAEPLQLLQIMREKEVRQLPLLDSDGRVQDLVTLEDLLPDQVLPVQAVIMAGGSGKRLMPLTQKVPKPMLPIGDRPLAERIIDQLCRAGIRRVHLTTHYKKEVIENHFRDGKDFGVEITYLREEEPLGTAGSLCMLEDSEEPLLVINGDILTGVDFRAMLDFHKAHSASMTVAVREHEFRLPYGAIQTEGVLVKGIVEKPVFRHFVNAGMYLLNPEVCKLIPSDTPYDIPDLILRVISENGRVVSFLVREYWRDIGEIKDYEKALADFANKEV